MAVQIRGRQILDSTITSGKIDLTGSFDFSSGTLQCGTPSANNDVANLAYVQSYVSGLAWKDACRVATTANITISSDLNVGDTIDGVTLADGDRVLVKNQSNQTENGIYVAGASPARASDMDAGTEFSSAAVFVSEGSVNADVGFVCTNDGTVTVGSSNITFSQFTGASQIVAGDGLAKSGNTLSVNVDDSSLEINSDSLRVKASGITNAMLAGSIENSKLSNSTISGVALGSNLNSLDRAENSGLVMSQYNGSSAVADLAIDFTELASGTVAVGADGFAFNDADGGTKIATIASLISGVAGSAASTSLSASSGVLSVKVDDTAVGRDLSGNLTVKAGGIGAPELASDAVTTAKISDANVTSAKLADSAVTNAKLADSSVSLAKLSYAGYFERVAIGDGTTSSVDLARAVDTGFVQAFTVCVNGLALEYKATPDNADNYKIDNTGAGSVGKITFGANLTNGDVVTIRYFA